MSQRTSRSLVFRVMLFSKDTRHLLSPRGSQQSIKEMHELVSKTKVGMRMSVMHPVFSWLVKRCAVGPNKVVVGSDGKTACARVHGRRHQCEMLEFCEQTDLSFVGQVHEFHHDRSGSSNGHLAMKSDGRVEVESSSLNPRFTDVGPG